MMTQTKEAVLTQSNHGMADKAVGIGGVGAEFQSGTPGASPCFETLALRNVEKPLSSLRVVACDNAWILTRSLLICFLARVSTREEWFTQKDWRRFSRTSEKLQRAIESIEDFDCRQTVIKYHTDLMMCRVFNDAQRPPQDEFAERHPLFTGFLRKFVNRAIARRDIAFIYSLSKGAKKSWPALSKVKRDATLSKHRERWALESPALPDDLVREIRSYSSRIFRSAYEIRDQATPLTSGKTRRNANDIVPTKLNVSTSACLQASRQKGGALSLTDPFNLDQSSHQPDHGSLRELNHNYELWRRGVLQSFAANVAERSLEGDEALQTVKIIDIAEPGKYRTVSLGDGYLYTVVQPLQQTLIECWKSTRHSTMLLDDLEEKITDIHHELAQYSDLHWVSGDFEAATDLLNQNATFEALSPLNSFDYDLAKTCLTVSRVKYPKDSGLEDLLNPTRGQAMGNPLSFPLLCVINLAALSCACRRWVNLSEFPVEKQYRNDVAKAILRNTIVNGDDILFKADNVLYQLWKEATADAGLKWSVGKNYYSSDCCMINSQVFKLKGAGITAVMKRYRYLNQSLVFGVNLKKDAEATAIQVCAALNPMYENLKWSRCTIPLAMKRFEKDRLEYGFQPDWFTPVHLGGYGLKAEFGPNPDLHGMQYTKRQRIVAAVFIANPDLALIRTMGSDRSWKNYSKMSALRKAFPNWRLIPSGHEQLVTDSEFGLSTFFKGEGSSYEDNRPYLIREHDVNSSDQFRWVARYNEFAKATHGQISDVGKSVLFKAIKLAKFFKPLTNEGFRRFNEVQFWATPGPACPPKWPVYPERAFMRAYKELLEEPSSPCSLLDGRGSVRC